MLIYRLRRGRDIVTLKNSDKVDRYVSLSLKKSDILLEANFRTPKSSFCFVFSPIFNIDTKFKFYIYASGDKTKTSLNKMFNVQNWI